MFCMRNISCRLIWMKFISMLSAFHVCAFWDAQAFWLMKDCDFNTEPFCSDVCGDHRRPQTLAERFRNMGICCGLRAVTCREKYPGYRGHSVQVMGSANYLKDTDDDLPGGKGKIEQTVVCTVSTMPWRSMKSSAMKVWWDLFPVKMYNKSMSTVGPIPIVKIWQKSQAHVYTTAHTVEHSNTTTCHNVPELGRYRPDAMLLALRRYRPGGWINIKMTSYQYRKSHCGDKTILRPSYLHNRISYTGKTTSLYWIGALIMA